LVEDTDAVMLRWIACSKSDRVEVEFVVVESPTNALTNSGEMGKNGIDMTSPDNKVNERD
jgi:hypothetical protein